MLRIIEKPLSRRINQRAILAFDFSEILIIWVAIALIPVWSWPVWGSLADTKNFLIFILVPLLFALEFIKATYINRGVYFGVLALRLNLILLLPAALAFITWGIMGFRMHALFGWGIPWFNSVFCVFLLVLWHFLLRSYFDTSSKKIFLRFTWILCLALALAFAIVQVKSGKFDFQDISWFFLFWTFLALSLTFVKIPYSKAGPKLDLALLSYPVIMTVIVASYFYFSFILDTAKAGSEFSKHRFEQAFKLNPFHPAYIVAFSNERIDELIAGVDQEDPAVLKQGVSQVMTNLSRLKRISDFELNVEIARTYAKISKLVEGSEALAKNYYEIALRMTPGDKNHISLLKEALEFYRLKSKDFKAGLELSQYALRIYPEEPSFIIEMSLVLEALNRNEDALNLLRDKQGTDLEIDYHYGRILYNLGRLDEAREVFLDVLSRDVNYSDANYSLATYYYRIKNYAQALGYFEKVKELNPENQDVVKKIQDVKSKLGL